MISYRVLSLLLVEVALILNGSRNNAHPVNTKISGRRPNLLAYTTRKLLGLRI